MFILLDDNQKYLRGQEVICQNEKCKSISRKIACPFCYQNKIFENETLKEFSYGKQIICDNEFCQKKFSVIFCPSCKITKIEKKSYNTAKKFFECPTNNDYSLLKGYCSNFSFMNCPKCDINFYFLEENPKQINSNISLFIKCPNKQCNINFSITDDGEIKLDIKDEEKNKIIKAYSIVFNQGHIIKKYSMNSNFKIIEMLISFKEILLMMENKNKYLYKNPFNNRKFKGESKENDEGKFYFYCFRK
jgi:hypothetical protein